MDEHLDAVVIGAGLGGLAAAATLARAGREVIVLEQSTEPGGYAQAFRRGPYRFDTSLHALNGLAPGGGNDVLYRELGIDGLLRLRQLDRSTRSARPASSWRRRPTCTGTSPLSSRRCRTTPRGSGPTWTRSTPCTATPAG